MSNNTTRTPDARDYLGGFLKKEDIDGALVVTLIDVRPEPMPETHEQKLIGYFDEFAKGLVLNATNLQLLMGLFQTHDYSQWKGTLCLYVDPTVRFAGRAVGGLRLRSVAAAPEQAAPQHIAPQPAAAAAAPGANGAENITAHFTRQQ